MTDRSRRSRVLTVAIPLLVFVVTTFGFLARPLLGQRTYTAVDLLERTAPYRDAIERPPNVVSIIQGDLVEQYGPAALMSRDTLEDGEWQTWDPHIAAGTPAGIPPLIANVAPPQWTYFVVPGWYAVGLAAAISILVCQWFMFLFLRRLGAGVFAAIIGAIAYTYTGTNLAFVSRIWAPFVLPAMLWAVQRLLERPRFANSLVLGAFVAWGWYEGFPSGWVYCCAATGGFAVGMLATKWWRARRDARTSEDDDDAPVIDDEPANRWVVVRAAWVGFAFLWGVALSALTLIPLVHEVSARDILAMRTFDDSSHLNGIQVFSILTSRVPGPPVRGPWWTNLNPFEGTTYLGATVVAIVAVGLVLALVRRLDTSDDGAIAWVYFSLLALVVTILSFVGTPLLTIAYKVPGIANNPIWRMRFLIGLGASVLVALTLDSVWRHGVAVVVRRRPVVRWWSLALGLAFGLIFARFVPRLVDLARGMGAVGLLRSDLQRNAAIAAAVVLVIFAAARWPRLVVVSALVTGSAVYLQLVMPAYSLTPAAPISDFFTEQKGHRALEQLTDGRYRFAASGPNFYWNTSELFGLYDLRGAALHAPEFRPLMHEVSDLSFTRDPFKIQLTRDEWNLDSPVLDHLGVRYFALGTDELPYGDPDRVATEPDSWVDVGADQPVRLDTELGRIDGVQLPLRDSGGCVTGTVHVQLERDGVTTTTSRPLHDVNGTLLSFAVKSPGEAPGPVDITVTSNNDDCQLQVGVTDTEEAAGAFLHIADEAPVRLASTEQAWIYERPSASPIITSYGQWKVFDTQADALAWLRTRPDDQSDVVPVVGDVPASAPNGEPATLRGRSIENESVTVRSDGSTASLVSSGQVIGDGWSVTVDGHDASMVLVDGAVMAVHVPAGEHVILFTYAPSTVKLGKAVTLAAILVAIVGLVFTFVRGRRRKDSASDRDDATAAPSVSSATH